jgi:acyl-CoA thioesterase II
LFDLEPHGPDTFVGIGPRYPWGGLYGGQIVAQALRAAAATVDGSQQVHSLRAYFIRRGDHTEPIRFEVDRIRNGRSFTTRRVVARQAVGAILNLEASFQAFEEADDIQTVRPPVGVPGPDELKGERWLEAFERREVPAARLAEMVDGERTGAGRSLAWMKTINEIGDDQLLQRCWMAYISDDMPTDAVRNAHPDFAGTHGMTFNASLDHTIWFHRPVRADRWHLYDVTCHSYVGARGLSIGHVFSDDGIHVATIAQEVLVRDVRRKQD